MARESDPIDISNLPEVQRIAEEVHRTGEPRVLRWKNEDVAIVQPVKLTRKRRIPRGRPTSADDPLWKLVGIGASEGPGDVSTDKHKYLGDAYAGRGIGSLTAGNRPCYYVAVGSQALTRQY